VGYREPVLGGVTPVRWLETSLALFPKTDCLKDFEQQDYDSQVSFAATEINNQINLGN
jgi:hypothetical protein